MLLSVSGCSSPSTLFLVSITFTDISSASPTFPLPHAYHAALYNSEAHSRNESFSSGCCATADFTCGKSDWHFFQFSYSPVGNSAKRFLINCCFHLSSCA